MGAAAGCRHPVSGGHGFGEQREREAKGFEYAYTRRVAERKVAAAGCRHPVSSGHGFGEQREREAYNEI